MSQSPEIGKLAEALSKAQGEFLPLVADAENPHFRSSFPSLASIKISTQPALTKYGLAVSQTTDWVEKTLMLYTALMHSSGQWKMSIYPVIPVKNDPQGFGSALSYGRRYMKSSILDLPPNGEDDDGHAASTKNDYAKPAAVERQLPTQIQSQWTPTENQIKRLFAIKKVNGWNDDDLKGFMEAHFRKQHTKDLNYSEYDQICKYIEDNPVEITG